MLRVISPLITPLVSIIGLTFVGTKILIGGFLFSAEEKQRWRMMYKVAGEKKYSPATLSLMNKGQFFI